MSFDFQEGEILLFDKPYKWTSFDVVNKARVFLKYYCHNPKLKVGHAGTLDPLATGLVIVCTGKKTKEIDLIQTSEKEYEAVFDLSVIRPSFDKETEVTQSFDVSNITEQQILAAAQSFLGEQEQLPPLFSAIKINGVRAYMHARNKNTEIEKEIQPRKIEIKTMEMLSFNSPFVKFRIVCSKGTYIRALARDFGKRVGCGAALDELRRTAVGDYRVEDALNIETFRETILNAEEK